MRQTTILILDLTGARLRLAIQRNAEGAPHEISGGNRIKTSVEMSDELPFPWGVAVQMTAQGLITVAGPEIDQIIETHQTLLFDNLRDSIAQINDEELQETLFAGFWHALGAYLFHSGTVTSGEEVFAFVVYPSTYPLALLNNLRAACANDERLRLSGFIPESVSLLLGALGAGLLQKTEVPAQTDDAQTISLILAQGEDEVEALRFSRSSSSLRLTLLGHLRSTAAELAELLIAEGWHGENNAVLILEDEKLSATDSASKDLERGARVLCSSQFLSRAKSNLLPQLKRLGAMSMACCVVGQDAQEETYHLTLATRLGLRFNQGEFLPLLTEHNRGSTYPLVGWKVFRLNKVGAAPLALKVYAGFCTGMDGSALLAEVTLSPADLDGKAHARSPRLLAFVWLDAPGNGEFTLGHIDDDYILCRVPFILPGVVN